MSVGENSPGARLAVVLYTRRASTTTTHPPKRGDWTLPRPVLPLTARTPPQVHKDIEGCGMVGYQTKEPGVFDPYFLRIQLPLLER